jgi:hypothetical protein
MANKAQNLTSQHTQTQPGIDSNNQRHYSTRGGWVQSLVAIALLLTSTGLVTGGLWLGFQLVVNPDTIIRVNQWLPEWAQIPTVQRESAQSLAQIEASLKQQEQITGEPLSLEIDTQTLQPKTILLPILNQRSNCQSDCKQINQLRLYQLSSRGQRQKPQNGETYYQLVNQVLVEGPEESFAIAPLIAEVASGSNRPLPLTELHRFTDTTPATGVWLYLLGRRMQGSTAIAYGQVWHYNPKRSHLSLMLQWTSPTGQVPKWQQVTGGGYPELVVDETVDLEPQLRVYQVKPAQFYLNPIQLEQISLVQPALNSPAYRDALFIARNGLWSPSYKWLQFIKQQRQKNQDWSAAAQAQMDLIRLYAQLTQKQAEKTWASPSQEVLADLIDGRWGKAMRVFQASPENTQEIASLLKADSGQLWNRVEAALQVNPNRPEVQAWGALIRAAKEGKGSAITWLKQQPKTTTASTDYIKRLLRHLEGDFSSPKISSRHSNRLVGSVEPVAKVNPAEWLQPNQQALNLEGKVWYRVQVAAYHDGKRWRRTPFSDLQMPRTAASSVWQQLGLDSEPKINIIVLRPDGQQETTIATVKAVQLQNGFLRLLVASSKTISADNSASLKHRPLALTEAALEWVKPDPIPLVYLTQQQQPIELTAILPVLWQELQKSSQTVKSPTPSFDQMYQQLGHWPVQLIDLTGDAVPEIVLTVAADAIANLNNPQAAAGVSTSKQSLPRTIIFSGSGKLLYSEFGTALPQSVRAIADLQDDEPPALLVEDKKTYYLRRWSNQLQRFE